MPFDPISSCACLFMNSNNKYINPNFLIQKQQIFSITSMASIDISNVAAGFLEDCTELIQRFVQGENTRFGFFCQIWVEMKFSWVFQ